MRGSTSTRLRLLAGVVVVMSMMLGVVQVAAAAAGDNTITRPDSVGDVGLAPSMVLNASGFPVISYYDLTNGDLKVMTCADPSCEGGNTIATPDSAGDVGQYSSLALNASGFPVIAYTDVTNGDLKILVCGNATCTSANVISSPDTADDVGYEPSMALSPAGFPVIAHHDHTKDDLRIVSCGNPTCTQFNVMTTVDPTGNVGQNPSLLLDSSGLPVVSYTDNTIGDLKLLRCGNATCTAGNTRTRPDSANISGTSSALALDSSGFPLIAYSANANSDLKLVICDDLVCGTGNLYATPDIVGLVGIFNSVALDSSGFAVVSYHDLTNGALKVLHCGDVLCQSNNSVLTVDSAGDSGLGTSLVLDASGFPVIAYYDFANGDLKVMHCGDADCTPTLCAGQPASIDMGSNGGDGRGTASDDVIVGTSGADSINGLGGEDIVCAGGGADSIRGGPGFDQLFGEAGPDTISGGGSADLLVGGPGADVIKGQGGSDLIEGNEGGDTLDGQGAADTLFGGDGPDIMNGQNGGDFLWGDAGADVMSGQTGPDTFGGGDDDDSMFGGNGADMLFGGDGFDKCSGNLGPDSAEAATCEQTPGVESLF